MAAQTPYQFRYHKKVYPSLDPTRPDLSAAGQTIFITGGGKAIGLGITESFALAKAKHIVILGREQDALEKARDDLGTKYPDTTIHPYAADITDSERCEEIFHEVREKVAPIDVLVLNAAYLHTPTPFPSLDIADFWRGFEVNVKANTQLAQLFLQTRNPDSATLINVSSCMAWLGALPFPAHGYSASKAAFGVVVGYLGAQETGLRVFTMHPGLVVTPMLVKVGSDTSREGVFDDVMLPGAFAVYLASPRAEFLRGKTLEANWDVDDMESKAAEIGRRVVNPEIELAAPLTVGLMGRSFPVL